MQSKLDARHPWKSRLEKNPRLLAFRLGIFRSSSAINTWFTCPRFPKELLHLLTQRGWKTFNDVILGARSLTVAAYCSLLFKGTYCYNQGGLEGFDVGLGLSITKWPRQSYHFPTQSRLFIEVNIIAKAMELHLLNHLCSCLTDFMRGQSLRCCSAFRLELYLSHPSGTNALGHKSLLNAGKIKERAPNQVQESLRAELRTYVQDPSHQDRRSLSVCTCEVY